MRVLIVCQPLEIGGVQVNAIELAGRVRDVFGHDVLFAAAPGPAQELLSAQNMDYRELPSASTHPSLASAKRLGEIADQFRPQVVHAWDWAQTLDAYGPLHLKRRLPLLCSVMTMVVPRTIPSGLPTTFGTVDLVAQARRQRRGAVSLLEPPVDLDANRPGSVDSSLFRRRYGLDGSISVGIVSRLERWRKLDGILRAIDAVADLAATVPMQLVIVGEGSASGEVRQRADAANLRVGRTVIQLTGGDGEDPRTRIRRGRHPVGDGRIGPSEPWRSARPLVVLGEDGFARLLDEESLDDFLHRGWWGVGRDRQPPLATILAELAVEESRRRTLGALGRRVVQERFSLEAATRTLDDCYAKTATTPPDLLGSSVDAGTTAAVLLAGQFKDKIIRTRQKAA